MDYLSPSDLKTILHSKRANIYYLEHCRILVNGGRVEYVTEQGEESAYWNIPIANTTSLLLGTGTSITQAAMRELAKAGVLVGFCGGGGTPLFASTEVEVDVAWLTPQSEYRPTEYLQKWVSFWFDEKRRVEAAKIFQVARLEQIAKSWSSTHFKRNGLSLLASSELDGILDYGKNALVQCSTTSEILALEAMLTKSLYKLVAKAVKYGGFVRAKNGLGGDPANRFLDQGNYLAYGLAATATWVLGIPHGLAVLHGKTRRGGLVFDVADLIKDALILPQAFISAAEGDENDEFRRLCIENFQRAGAMDTMIDTLKKVAEDLGKTKQ